MTLTKIICKPIREARIIKYVEDYGIAAAVYEINLRRWEVNEIISSQYSIETLRDCMEECKGCFKYGEVGHIAKNYALGCSRCGVVGYIARNCNQAGCDPHPHCTKCGNNGHVANDCSVDLTKKFLSSNFSMKDMGKDDVILSKSHYIEKVLKKFNYFDCTPLSTPMDTSEKLMPNNGQVVSQLEYSRVIGCLMYAMTCTRPDIMFTVGKLSRYTSKPGTQHWKAIQRVLKYLKKTMDNSLTYIGYPSVMKGYTNARWINNTKDNSSTSGWVFMLGGATVGKEAEWLRNPILKIPLWSKPIAPISILCDSVATLTNAYSQMYNGKSRQLGVRHSMIHELITNEVVSLEFVRSQRNLSLDKGIG
ncbi:zinc finger, CCHC-type containing protein [Tanacetum coccineum]